MRQARAAELLEGRDRARRQAEADRHAWAAERTALKSAIAGLQVRSHSLCRSHSCFSYCRALPLQVAPETQKLCSIS